MAAERACRSLVHERRAVACGLHRARGEVRRVPERAAERAGTPTEGRRECEPARNSRGEVDAGPAAQLLDGVHCSRCIVRVRDGSPEHGEQHDALVAARALQHVAAELVDQVGRRREEAAEIRELRWQRDEHRGHVPVLVGRASTGRHALRRDRMQRELGPGRLSVTGSRWRQLEIGVLDSDPVRRRALFRPNRCVEPRADVREHVPRRRRVHRRCHGAAADPDPHPQLDGAGERRRPSRSRHERDDVLGRAPRIGPGFGGLERGRDGVAAEGDRIPTVTGDGVESAADGLAHERPELLGAGRAMGRQTLGEAGESGQVGEERHGISRQRPGGGGQRLAAGDVRKVRSVGRAH